MKGVIAGADMQFYTDELKGLEAGWEGIPAQIPSKEYLETSKTVTVPEEGTYVLQYRMDLQLEVEMLEPTARLLPWQRGQHPEQIMYLKKGENRLRMRIYNPIAETLPCDMTTRLLDSRGNLVGETDPESTDLPVLAEFCQPLPPYTPIAPDGIEPDLTGYTPAAGVGFASCGRFGYAKGDGVLDYSMPAFGIVTRPFISGHPRYRRNWVWNFSLLPPGEWETGVRHQTYHVPENETVECDWTHTRWSRKLSDGTFIAYDYSVLSAALLIETDRKELNLSRLDGIGTFRTVTLPLAAGAVTRGSKDGVFYDVATDGPLAQNWVLLSRSGQFPEVPLLLTLPASPERILRTGDTVTISFAQPVQWAMLSFPYGIRLFDTQALTEQWYAEALPLCAAAHSRNLARPVACREYFKADTRQVQILDHYTYRHFTDSLHTPGTPAALLPPPAVLAGEEVSQIVLDDRAVPLDHPTKYGPLYGVPGSSFCRYTLPVPGYRYEFPFNCPEADKLADAMHEDFDGYLQFHREERKETRNPGNYSFVFQYALPAKLFPVLKPEDLQRLKDAMETGLQIVSNPDFCYTGPGGRKCCSWYKRTEPFTGVSYYSTYLQVADIFHYANCDRETIENSDRPFIEVDWGNAMSLYGTYLAALITGRWDMIREHWQVFRKAFDYYLVTMDWACMTAAYSEIGITWNDGTNYGGYLGFLNMADILNMEEDRNLALYAYAKMTAMRMGLFVSTQNYFHRYFGVEPWYTAKHFHEETDASRAFLNYPDDILGNNYRGQALYNMTTEGHYTEAMQMYAAYLPEETEKTLRAAEGAVTQAGNTMTGATDLPILYHSNRVGILGHHETFTYLILSAMLGRFSRDTLKTMIREAADNNRISKEMLGHPVWSRRRVPANWTYATLMCQLDARSAPCITAWQDLEIVRANYPSITVATRTGGWLEFSSPTAPTACFEGQPLVFSAAGTGLWRTAIPKSGTVTF